MPGIDSLLEIPGIAVYNYTHFIVFFNIFIKLSLAIVKATNLSNRLQINTSWLYLDFFI